MLPRRRWRRACAEWCTAARSMPTTSVLPAGRSAKTGFGPPIRRAPGLRSVEGGGRRRAAPGHRQGPRGGDREPFRDVRSRRSGAVAHGSRGSGDVQRSYADLGDRRVRLGRRPRRRNGGDVSRRTGSDRGELPDRRPSRLGNGTRPVGGGGERAAPSSPGRPAGAGASRRGCGRAGRRAPDGRGVCSSRPNHCTRSPPIPSSTTPKRSPSSAIGPARWRRPWPTFMLRSSPRVACGGPDLR